MKCAVAFCCVLIAGCTVLLADAPDPRPSISTTPDSSPALRVLEDVVRMSRAGASEATVLAYARTHRAELPAEIADKTLRWLRASGVGDRVVRYMSAIDVRASEWPPSVPEGVTWADRRGDRDDDAEPPAEREPARSYREAEAYAGYESDPGGYGYGNDYDYDVGFGYAPFFGYPYVSAPFFSWVFVDRGDFSRRFDNGGHRIHRGPRFDGGHRGGGWRDRGGPRDAWRARDAWRERGGGRREGWIGSRPRNVGGPRDARRSFTGGFRGPRGGDRALSPRGPGSPGSMRGGVRSFHGARGVGRSARGSGVGPSRGGAGLGHAPAGGRGRR